MVEKVRGTANIGLTELGKKQVEQAGEMLKKLGGLDLLYYSNLNRCVQTADILFSILTLKKYNLGPEIDPWHLGEYEGQPVEEVKDKLEYYVFHPDEVVPGVGFNAPGESFNQFKKRFLAVLYELRRRSKACKIGVVANYRTLTLARAWMYAGANSTDIVSSAMFVPARTGEVLYLSPISTVTEEITDDTKNTLENGIYIIRHGETPWNGTSNSSNGNGAGS